MDIVTEFGFDCQQGRSRDMQEWLRANQEKLRAEAPSGWEYIGTFASVMSTEKAAGDYRQLWRHDSYGAMDAWAEAMQGPSAFAQLYDEFTRSFVDEGRDAHFSQTLMKSMTDVTMWGSG